MKMGDQEAELLMPTSSENAMRQAEILALRSVSDAMAQLATRFDRVEAKQDEMNSSLIRIEAQDLRGALAESKLDFEKYKESRVVLTAAYEARVKAIELIVARYTGMFIPVSILAAAMTSATAAMLIQKVFGHG